MVACLEKTRFDHLQAYVWLLVYQQLGFTSQGDSGHEQSLACFTEGNQAHLPRPPMAYSTYQFFWIKCVIRSARISLSSLLSGARRDASGGTEQSLCHVASWVTGARHSPPWPPSRPREAGCSFLFVSFDAQESCVRDTPEVGQNTIRMWQLTGTFAHEPRCSSSPVIVIEYTSNEYVFGIPF